jgi:hypothetical protein
MWKYLPEKEHVILVNEVIDGKIVGYDLNGITRTNEKDLNAVTNAITLHHARMVMDGSGSASALSVITVPPQVVDDQPKDTALAVPKPVFRPQRTENWSFRPTSVLPERRRTRQPSGRRTRRTSRA